MLVVFVQLLLLFSYKKNHRDRPCQTTHHHHTVYIHPPGLNRIVALVRALFLIRFHTVRDIPFVVFYHSQNPCTRSSFHFYTCILSSYGAGFFFRFFPRGRRTTRNSITNVLWENFSIPLTIIFTRITATKKRLSKNLLSSQPPLYA